MSSRVVVKKVFADDDSDFTKEVEIWSQLYHPHVLQLFGACHVGQKFIVSEFAAQGRLDIYLSKLKNDPVKRKQETWRTLYEAALGLQYLHDRGVIHCDLKCNNFLIGRDGKTKVSDYGLSRSQQHQGPVSTLATGSTTDDQQSSGESNGVGAPRWKAPEILSGAAPTPESDVKPRCFSDEQWDLVVGACRFNPQERTSLSEIVSKLRDFARDSSSIDELVEPEPELPEMRSDADSGCREDSEDDEFAPPVNNANANRFVDEDDDL
ncbi:hypothetical protein P43SY_005628 [Pythium insidiosum]|uniref:Protein kinase domain-containing protein n=1 Tax=Pythium insidiosum TaxID=114742 RepID=A0AAD5M0T8_PYTIN|nr:hypothetical protein P43SY_005628 [Pythium insidiosum]